MNWKKIFKFIFLSILIVLATGIVFFHNSFNLGGDYLHNYVGVVSNEAELVDFITNAAKSSTLMNYNEIAIWVFSPSVLLSLAIIVWKGKKFFPLGTVLLIAIGSFVILFSIETITNNMGIRNQLKRELPIWRKHFQSAEQSGLKNYKIWDEDNFETGHSGRITTSDFDYNSIDSLAGNRGRILDHFSLSRSSRK